MTPYHATPDATFFVGDCREVLKALEPESINLACTSPPYFSLRKYQGVEPAVWGANDPDCDHLWGDTVPGDNRGGSGTPTDKNNRGEGYARAEGRGQFCQKCGCWRGCLGLEPDPDCGQHGGLAMAELRDDLTDEQRAYVISELVRLGVVR